MAEKKTIKSGNDQIDVLENQKCPMCMKNTLTLLESEKDIPYFGRVFLFSMDCSNKACNYHKADLEAAERQEPCKYTFDVKTEDDLKVRVVKSGEALVKIPRIMSIEPGSASNGYVTNVEGILNRVKMMLEKTRDDADDKSDRKKAKNMLKKVQDALWGRGEIKIILEDKSGNSAIISEKAVKSKL
ncbi:ZPR1 zinc finger domain-containing protein [Candidatus Woesearchaeota archaeon]|jgi:zinc finger protein|nr:ZPR1 zinc finger domain-containing protein [Candidatus Woesearchaeota archaeon]